MLYLSPKALEPLLGFLRRAGAAPEAPSPVPVGPADALLGRYQRYLVTERGLAAETAAGYAAKVRAFAAARVEDGLAGLTAAEVTAFVVETCPSMRKGTAKLTVTALRSLLGWLHLAGEIPGPLAWAVPAVASWRLAALPVPLDQAQVQAMLDGCDTGTAVGRRDLAMLTLLGRLGLRAGEVAGLTLEDIDWRAGEITVTGKGRRSERLPLPADVGEAVAAYLSGGRPRAFEGARNVFLRSRAPHRRLDLNRGQPGSLRRRAAGRDRRGLRAPAAALRGHGDAAGRGVASRGRPGAAAPAAAVHGDLRQNGRPRAPGAGAPLAGRRRGMSALSQAVADYLAVRRSLGYKFARPETLLGQFTAYLEQAGAATVTAEHALAWAVLPDGDPSWHAYRLAVARGFAAWLATTDPDAEIPPAGLIPSRKHRATPYLYTDSEIAALITAAGSLRFQLRTATYQTLIGLLAVTGMRVGEAIGLNRDDADLNAGVLTVRNGKHGKSRLVPVHDTTARALRDYQRVRDRLCPDAATPAVLISPAGTRLLYCNVHATWKKLAASAGLRPRSGSCRPRIHDLRHSFAVRTMLDAYESGLDGQATLFVLSTYLGHADPKATYWYLSASPELMAAAGQRLAAWLERP